jgi:hypothetical protein
VLIPGYHGGMFDHNTRRVLTSFHIVFLTFDLCFRQVTSDSSKGATIMIIRVFCFIYYYQKSIILACCFVDLVQVTGDNLKEAIVKVAKRNILDEI